MMSSADERGFPIAARTGSDLRAARERLGWLLPDVAAHLRIRLPFLEALEAGRIADLPGNAYAVGFVRTYAKALGLDPDEMARRFRAEAAEVNRKTELEFPAPVPERGVPAGALLLLGLAICVGAYAGWYRMTGDRPAPEPIAAVPERLAALATPPKPDPSLAAATMSAKPDATPAPSPTLSISASPTQAQAAPELRPVIQAVQAAPTGLSVRAKADAWLQVRDRQGQVLLSRVLRAGESYTFPTKGQFLMTTGNSGGTEVVLDGTVLGTLGADGVVRKDVPFDPDKRDEVKALVAATMANPYRVPGSSPKLQ